MDVRSVIDGEYFTLRRPSEQKECFLKLPMIRWFVAYLLQMLFMVNRAQETDRLL